MLPAEIQGNQTCQLACCLEPPRLDVVDVADLDEVAGLFGGQGAEVDDQGAVAAGA